MEMKLLIIESLFEMNQIDVELLYCIFIKMPILEVECMLDFENKTREVKR